MFRQGCFPLQLLSDLLSAYKSYWNKTMESADEAYRVSHVVGEW